MAEKNKEHAASLTAAREEHTRALEDAHAQHAAALDDAEQKHTAALAEQQEQHTALAAEMDRQHAVALASALEKEREQHLAALAEARQVHEVRAVADRKALEAAQASGDAEHSAALQSALEAQAAAHAAALARRTTQHDTLLAQSKNEHEVALRAQAEAHARELAAARDQHTGSLAASNEGHSRALASAHTGFETQLASALAAREKEHEHALKEQRERHAAALGEKIAEATATAGAVASLKRRLELAEAQAEASAVETQTVHTETAQLQKAYIDLLGQLKARDADLAHARTSQSQLAKAEAAVATLNIQVAQLEQQLVQARQDQTLSQARGDDSGDVFQDAVDRSRTPTPTMQHPASKSPGAKIAAAPASAASVRARRSHGSGVTVASSRPESPAVSSVVAVQPRTARSTVPPASALGTQPLGMVSASALLEDVHAAGNAPRRKTKKSTASAKSALAAVDLTQSRPNPTMSVPPPPRTPPPPGPVPRRSQPPIFQSAPPPPSTPIPANLIREVNAATSPAAGTGSKTPTTAADQLHKARSSATMRSKRSSKQTPAGPTRRRSVQSDFAPAVTPAGTAVVTSKSKYHTHGSLSDASTRSSATSDVTSRAPSLLAFDADRTLQPGQLSFGETHGASRAAITAVTTTMIGSSLYKYVRNTLPFGTEKRHKRYVWIHPYTMTVYWSAQDPGSTQGAQSKAKSAGIDGMAVVDDYTSAPPTGLYHKAIVLQTASRKLKFTAPDRDTHDTWVASLSYLLRRDSGVPVVEDPVQPTVVAHYNPASPVYPRPGSAHSVGASSRRRSVRSDASATPAAPSAWDRSAPHAYATGPRRPPQHRPSSRSSLPSLRPFASPPPVPPLPSLGMASPSPRLSDFGPVSLSPSPIPPSGSMNLTAEQMIEEDQAGMSFEGVDNARVCCDGKHDVGSLAHHRHSHVHPHTHTPQQVHGLAHRSTRASLASRAPSSRKSIF